MAPFPDLIVIGQEEWGPIARRNRLLLEALAQANPQSRFLFVEIPIRPRGLARERPRALTQVRTNIWTMRPARLLPDRVGAAAESVEAWQIRRAAAQIGLWRPVAWTQDPRAANLLRALRTHGLIYDLTDDWEAFEEDPGRRQVVATQIQALLTRADVVLACSPYLRDYAERHGASATLVPNAAGDMSSTAVHPRLTAIPSPRLGYLGTLHEARLDLELLRHAANLRPDWAFVLLGPNHLSAEANRSLQPYPNIVSLGPCPYEEVPAVLAGFDVGLVPHIVNPVSESLDPLKMYEYAAAGVPIVATPVGIPPELAGAVTLVSTAEELVDAVGTMLTAAPAGPSAAQISAATWGERATRVQAAVSSVPALTGPVPGAGTGPVVSSAHTAESGAGPSRPGLVSVIVVSYNTAELTLRAIASVREQSEGSVQVICVDNASTDGSAAAIAQAFPDVELIESPVNLGFGPANNLARKRCRGRFTLLLNSDAILAGGALGELLAAAERHPRSAVFGPRLLNADGSLQRSAWPFPSPGGMLIEAVGAHRLLRRLPGGEDLGLWDHRSERSVDFLSGACLLIRSEVLDVQGGFDESFPFYAEETDLQYRIHQSGWEVTLVPDAVVTHLGSGSSTGDQRRARLFFGAQRRYIEKHFGQAGVSVGRVAMALSAVLRRRWALVPLAFLPLPRSPEGVGERPAPAALAPPRGVA